MKRIAFLSVLSLAIGAAAVMLARDSLYWKRRVSLTFYSSADLPAAYYEPTQIIEGSDGPSPPRVTPEQERLDPVSLRAAAEYAGERDTIALIVGRHGHVVFEQYWEGANYDTRIDAGAFSSTLAAIMVGIAIDDRKIGLAAEPVANYIESFRDDNRSAVTLAHLLGMTSGLGSNPGRVDPGTPSADEQLAHDVRLECLEREPVAPPGSRFAPQLCDPQLLAHVLERATGEPYAAYISERLWKPIGAGDAFLMLDHEGGTAHAGCCLRARLADWMRIAELLANDGVFQGGQIVSPGWMRTMRTPHGAARPFGYQVWLGEPFVQGEGASEPYASDDILVLKGNGKTRLWVVPSMGLSILRAGRNDDIDVNWDDSRVPNLIIRGASDYMPKAPRNGAQDISNLVPRH